MKILTNLELYTRQSCLACTHLLQRSILPILTAASLQYFIGCFPLVFLESCYLFLFPEMTFLCLDPVAWKLSAPTKKVVLFANTSSKS